MFCINKTVGMLPEIIWYINAFSILYWRYQGYKSCWFYMLLNTLHPFHLKNYTIHTKSLRYAYNWSQFFLLQHICALISCYWHRFIHMWLQNLNLQFCHIQFEKVAEFLTSVAELWSLRLIQKGLVVPLMFYIYNLI